MRSWNLGFTRWAALLLLAAGAIAADNPWDAKELDIEAITAAHAATVADLKKPAEDAAQNEQDRYAAKQERKTLLEQLLLVLVEIRDFDKPEASEKKKSDLTKRLAELRAEKEPPLGPIETTKDIAKFEAAVAEAAADSKTIKGELKRFSRFQKEIAARMQGKSARDRELRESVGRLTNAAPETLEAYQRENVELELRLLAILTANKTDLDLRIDAATARAHVQRDFVALQAKRASETLARANKALGEVIEAAGKKRTADQERLEQEALQSNDELVKYEKRTLADVKGIKTASGEDKTRLSELKAVVSNERTKLEGHRLRAKRQAARVDHRTRISSTTADTLHKTLLRVEGWRQTIEQRSRPETARNNEELDLVLGPLQDRYWDLELAIRQTAAWSKLSESLQVDRADETEKALEPLFRDLRDALRQRITGIERLQAQYLELDSVLEEQSETLRALETFIRGRIYWVRTDERLGVHLVASARSEFDRLKTLYTEPGFVKRLDAVLDRKPVLVFGSTIFLALFLIGAVFGARRVGRKQMRLGAEGNQIRSVLRDALIVLTHAALPSLVLLIGIAIVREVGYPGRIERPAIAAMSKIAYLLLIQRLGWGMLRADGFLVAHFGLNPDVGRQLQRSIRIYTMGFMMFSVPFDILTAAQELEVLRMPSMRRLFGTLFRMSELLAVGLLLPRRLPVARSFVSGSEMGLRILGLLNPFFCTALLLIVLMDILGYRYGAEYFADRVIHNVVMVVIVRGLYAGMSQLSNRVVARVRERAAAEHGGTAAWQDATNISRQLTRLISVSTIVIAFVFLSQSWSLGSGSVNVLKEWSVMTFESAPALTVFDLVAAALSIASAHFLASNIAGLFELLVFPVFGTIHRGSRYVVLALTRYLILTIGYATALVIVHFSLSSVGWLLTAASFGLGFGLQEIIANFVSGLMMMVEQPLRVGDVISVGETSGTVERITIRATIVTNWDQQQIIIPNKEFITKNLTNWTRNNPFTRRKISIRVAFGSDVEKILKLLEETVKEVENVRSYPPVRIWFKGVGEYTLDFIIWAYIDVDFGFSTQSAIRRAVHAALASEGVDIPLPQTDIHLKGGDDARAAAETTEFLGDGPPPQ